MRTLLAAMLMVTSAKGTPEPVSFLTQDGWTIHADLYGAGDRGVVLVHGGRFTKESWREQAGALVKAGFRVLAIDLRGYGHSTEGPKATRGEMGSPLDVLAAIRYLRGGGVKTVSLVGGSMGGDAAGGASAMAESGDIDALVLLASAGAEAPQSMKGRKLFVLCRDDRQGGVVPRLPAIRGAYEKAPDPKKMVILECSAHAQFIFATPQGPPLLRDILSFLSSG